MDCRISGPNDNPDSSGTPNTNYFVEVISPPPTVHDTGLESAVIAFVGAQPDCKIVGSRRSENPATAAGMFDFTLKIRRSRMHEAALCDQIEPTYDSKACDDVPGVRELKSRQP